MAVRARCNGQQLSIFLDSGVTANIINLSTLAKKNNDHTTTNVKPEKAIKYLFQGAEPSLTIIHF